jgi:tRNA threonylcarbamoyladenosine biosynthesis protein TsaB
MIDARRMEVFSAVYDNQLDIVEAPAAVLLEENSFSEVLKDSVVVFSGSGSKKFQAICLDAHAVFSEVVHNAGHLAFLTARAYSAEKFSDPVYAAPFYLKEFYTPPSK